MIHHFLRNNIYTSFQVWVFCDFVTCIWRTGRYQKKMCASEGCGPVYVMFNEFNVIHVSSSFIHFLSCETAFASCFWSRTQRVRLTQIRCLTPLMKYLPWLNESNEQIRRRGLEHDWVHVSWDFMHQRCGIEHMHTV